MRFNGLKKNIHVNTTYGGDMEDQHSVHKSYCVTHIHGKEFICWWPFETGPRFGWRINGCLGGQQWINKRVGFKTTSTLEIIYPWFHG